MVGDSISNAPIQVDMNYMKLLTLLVLLFVSLAVHAAPQVTIVNDEMSPLYITSGSAAEIPEEMTLEQAQVVLHRHRDRLVAVAPGNMVPYTLRGSVLIGYYGGNAAAVAFHAVRRTVPAGATAVRIDRRSFLQHNRRPVVFTTNQLPEHRDPIILGAGSAQWRGTEQLFVLPESGLPVRIEHTTAGHATAGHATAGYTAAGHTAAGREMSAADALFWNVGGTQAEHVRYVAGERGWFLRIQTEPPILDGTGYHFAVYDPSRHDDESYIGEIIALQAGPAGPVIFRNGNTIGWAGQYLRQDGVVEIHLDRGALTALGFPAVADMRSATASETATAAVDPIDEVEVVFATSHRRGGRSERFTMDTMTIPLQ